LNFRITLGAKIRGSANYFILLYLISESHAFVREVFGFCPLMQRSLAGVANRRGQRGDIAHTEADRRPPLRLAPGAAVGGITRLLWGQRETRLNIT
jgi:hypothetical protein